MTDAEIRQVIADALGYASVPLFRGSATEASFVAGDDILLSALEIDSLAAMELCIAIETNIGVSILPQQLAEMASLTNLVNAVREGL